MGYIERHVTWGFIPKPPKNVLSDATTSFHLSYCSCFALFGMRESKVWKWWLIEKFHHRTIPMSMFQHSGENWYRIQQSGMHLAQVALISLTVEECQPTVTMLSFSCWPSFHRAPATSALLRYLLRTRNRKAAWQQVSCCCRPL